MNEPWKKFEKDGAKYSPTEEFGLNFIKTKHIKILSVGISTAGFAEVRMALENRKRKIIATTLDKNGLLFTQELVNKFLVENQISLKIEDVSSDLIYEDNSLDFVYARLVFHYLDKLSLRKSLKSMYKILKKQGEMFIVVRSYDWESEVAGAMFDLNTNLTTYPSKDLNGNIIKYSTRYLHSIGSISSHLIEVGFIIKDIQLFSEKIYCGFERVPEKENKLPANLIAIHVVK